MFIMDVPYVPAQETPIVLAQADTAVGSTPPPDYLLKVCRNTTSSVYDKTAAIRSIDPGYALANYLNSQPDKQVVFDLASIKNITLLEGTKHGELLTRTASDGRTTFRYNPIPNYVGDDRAVFMAEFEGKHYKIVMNLKVTFSVDNYLCPDNPYELIKVNKPSTGSSGYDMGSISVTFADLDGSAIGLTNASGITLDTNAAGHNWYIDTTPWDNSEYLPTSNPYEWVAKEGTAAYGKMDMLSVLLEYGHALGIDHSADKDVR